MVVVTDEHVVRGIRVREDNPTVLWHRSRYGLDTPNPEGFGSIPVIEGRRVVDLHFLLIASEDMISHELIQEALSERDLIVDAIAQMTVHTTSWDFPEKMPNGFGWEVAGVWYSAMFRMTGSGSRVLRVGLSKGFLPGTWIAGVPSHQITGVSVVDSPLHGHGRL